MHKIPAFYHPTTLTLVDDDHDFLMGLALVLEDYFRCHTFTLPDEVEDFSAQPIQNKSWMILPI